MFEQKYEKYQTFYLKTSSFLVENFSIYLNRRVYVMTLHGILILSVEIRYSLSDLIISKH